MATLTGREPDTVDCIPCAGFSSAVFHPRDDAARGRLRQALGIEPACRIALFVGHLAVVKGLDVLLRAWARVRLRDPATPARLVLVGEGPERAALGRLAAALGIERAVVFMGAQPQAAVADWMAASDVFCLASHAEGSPNVVVEALASGLPVVASRVGGIPDLVRGAENVRLVAPGDEAAFATALGELLATRPRATVPPSTITPLTWHDIARRNLAVLAGVA